MPTRLLTIHDLNFVYYKKLITIDFILTFINISVHVLTFCEIFLFEHLFAYKTPNVINYKFNI